MAAIRVSQQPIPKLVLQREAGVEGMCVWECVCVMFS